MFGPFFMRAIDRVHAERHLITTINAQMDWDDAELFFKRLHVPRPKLGSSYTFTDLVRGYLKDCTDEALLEIANQLGIDVPQEKSSDGLITLGDSKYWLTDHLRVFISHVHTAKTQAAGLREGLKKYAISAFVAHDDIETSDEWREEILRSLMSMDAFVAIIAPDFNSSKWTDQEVGIAVARDVLLIPINRGENPYGFLAKYQALPTKGLKAKDVAAEVFKTICANARTRSRMIECLTRTISAGSISESLFRIEKLNGIDGVGLEDWERVRENVASSTLLGSAQQVLNVLNPILQEKQLSQIEISRPSLKPLDDDIPF